MQGFQDLSDVEWNAETSTYSGSAKVISGEPFIITIAPNGLTPKEVTVSGGTANITKQGDLIRLSLNCEKNSEIKWSITWSK
jgi:hypothetical protein